MDTNEALALRAQQGDREALAQLWTQVKGFAIRQACRYTPTPRVSREDLIQCAYLGMHRAVQGYDSARGCGFLHYMDFCLRQECRSALGLYGKPSLEADCSLDAAVRASESGTPLYALIADGGIEDAQEHLARMQLRQAVRQAVERLRRRDARMIRRYYFGGMNLCRIAREEGISHQAVQQALVKALGRLRSDRALQAFLAEYGFSASGALKGQTKGKRKKEG